MGPGRRISIIIRLPSLLSICLSQEHRMEGVLLAGEEEQHLGAHDANTDAGMEHLNLSLCDMHIVQL